MTGASSREADVGTNRFDSVVIGGGVGGLCAAARLAHSGQRVLLLEKLKFVGGRFTDVAVDGTHISTGGIGVEVGGPFQETFDLVGASFDVLKPPDPATRYRLEGRDVDIAAVGGLKHLVMSAARTNEEGERVYAAFRRAISWEAPTPGIPLTSWLRAYTDNEDVIGIFAGICEATYGGPADMVPAREFIRFIKVQRGYRSFGFARKGNRALIESLATRLREIGVEILTRATVVGIDVARHQVKGVIYEARRQRHRIEADNVVSNVGPKATVELVGRSHFDPGYLALVDGIRPMSIIAIICRAAIPLHDFPGMTLTSLSGTRRVSVLITPTLVAPSTAAPGHHIIESYGIVRDTENWESEVEANLQDLEELLPGFVRSEHVLRVNCFSGGWPACHASIGQDVGPRTPIERLYNVGDGAKPKGWSGIGACAESARLAAEDIVARSSRGNPAGAPGVESERPR